MLACDGTQWAALFLAAIDSSIVSSHQPDPDFKSPRIGLCGDPVNPNTTASIIGGRTYNFIIEGYCCLYSKQ